MDDLSVMQEMLTRAGLDFESESRSSRTLGDHTVVTVEGDAGYSGFFAVFVFDADGALLDAGGGE